LGEGDSVDIEGRARVPCAKGNWDNAPGSKLCSELWTWTKSTTSKRPGVPHATGESAGRRQDVGPQLETVGRGQKGSSRIHGLWT